MALCIALGQGSKAAGFACISVGDGVVTRGAFQVKLGSQLTLPNLTTEEIEKTIASLTDLCLTYQALSEQNFAPPEFGENATRAIQTIIDVLEERMPKVSVVADAPAMVEDKGKEEEVSEK